MRRLTAAIYEFFLGIRITTAKQHIEDLRKMLNGLCDARDSLQSEIDHTSQRLAEAHLRLRTLQEKSK